MPPFRSRSTKSPPEYLVAALGEKLSRAHVKPTYDWRAMLRLPHPKQPAPHAAAEPVAVKAEAIEASGEDIPSLISTPHGDITLSRLPDGRYALRNEKNGALIEVVKTACRGRAQWSPRFRNWVADESTMKEIVAKIRDHPQARA